MIDTQKHEWVQRNYAPELSWNTPTPFAVKCSLQPDEDTRQCVKDRWTGDDKDRPLDDVDEETIAALLELLEGDKDEDGSANLLWLHGYSMLKVSQSQAGAGKTDDSANLQVKNMAGDDDVSWLVPPHDGLRPHYGLGPHARNGLRPHNGQSMAGAGKTEDVPAPERTKTEEGDEEESESDEEYARSCKMMRLSLAAMGQAGQLVQRAWTTSLKDTPWWEMAEYGAAEKKNLWDKMDETTDFVDFSCYLSQDYSTGMVAVADKAFRFVLDVTQGRDYKVRLRAYNYVMFSVAW